MQVSQLLRQPPNGHAGMSARLVVRANYEKHALRVSHIVAAVAGWTCEHVRPARCSRK